MSEQRDTQTTLTTRDMYRKAVLDQYHLINKQKKEVFERDTPPEIAQGVVGVYWSIASLKTLLNIYVSKGFNDKGDLENIDEYQKAFNNLNLDFTMLLVNPDLSTIRKFIGVLNDWQDLLTFYFSDAGLLPKKRIIGDLETEDILKIESLEDLSKAIKRLIPNEHTEQIMNFIKIETGAIIATE